MNNQKFKISKYTPKYFQKISPGRALIYCYLSSILIGSLLLCMSISANGQPLSFIDALFTATSAQCVTGLILFDTGAKFTIFGQLVILFMIQIGGIGIITFSIYLFLYIKRSISSYGKLIIQETLMHTPISSWKELISSVIKMTLAIEAVGAICLAFRFIPDLGFFKGMYFSIFHSISAFCNAGFSLFDNNMISYKGDFFVNAVIGSLIVLGGIGFLVIKEVYEIKILRTKGRAKLSLHSKIVLITSIILIVLGALVFWLLEDESSMLGMPAKEQILISFFQSISARTAGFNTIDISSLRVSTILMIMFLMFVGASPGSSGGGVKTTSLAVFFLVVVNRIKQNPNINVFRRTIPEDSVIKALIVVVIAFILIAISVFCLLIIQINDFSHEGGRDFIKYLFESVSAIGTVGLSMGVTSSLTPIGKIIITILMFVGRVGLLTFAFTITSSNPSSQSKYAEENIMIG